MHVERLVVVFLDGVGLAEADPAKNPLARADMPVVQSLLEGGRLVREHVRTVTRHASLLALDARLGIPGLPQSGTGQTTLLTGVNAPALLGYHDGPYPNQQLRALLDRGNLFRSFLALGHPVAYANAYTDRFLRRITRGTQRLSANSWAALLAGLTLRGAQELRSGKAVSGLLTNDYFHQQGYQVPSVTPEQAGENLARLAQEHILSYFEFWITDLAGHRRDWELALHILQQLDRFLLGLLDHLDLTRSLVLVISDHGNLEDMSTPRHTLNPAMALVIGTHHAAVAARLNDLTDVTPTLLTTVNQKNGPR
ncbi:MAG: peptidase [Anaerolineae bacterium]|nr:peptidase [Anaerolineae bacterium]MDW8070351.1 peptidase [Anaerolineae bacterium]